jgi:hypothetical protein
VVKRGQLHVYDTKSGAVLSVLDENSALLSLMELTDMLTALRPRTDCALVGARAGAMETHLVRVPRSILVKAISDYPEALRRLVHVVAGRLQRITFLLMYQYLGLGTEFVQQPTVDALGQDLVALATREPCDLNALLVAASESLANLLAIPVGCSLQ